MLYLSQDSHPKLYTSYKQSGSALSVLLYFILKEVSTEYTSLKFNVLSAHLLNKQMDLFDKNVSIEPQFYNYPTIVP